MGNSSLVCFFLLRNFCCKQYYSYNELIENLKEGDFIISKYNNSGYESKPAIEFLISNYQSNKVPFIVNNWKIIKVEVPQHYHGEIHLYIEDPSRNDILVTFNEGSDEVALTKVFQKFFSISKFSKLEYYDEYNSEITLLRNKLKVYEY